MDAEAQKKLQEYSEKYFSDSEEKKVEFHTQLTPEEAEAAHIYTPAKKQEKPEDERDAKKEMNQTGYTHNPMVSPSNIMRKMGIDTGTAIVPNTPKPDFGAFGKRIEKAMNRNNGNTNNPTQTQKETDDIPITIIPEPPKTTTMLKDEDIDSDWMQKIIDCIKNKTPRKDIGFGGEIHFSNIKNIFCANNTRLTKLIKKDADEGKINRRLAKGKRGRLYIYNIRDIIEFGQRHNLDTKIIVKCSSAKAAKKRKEEELAKHGLGPNFTKLKEKENYDALKFPHKEVKKEEKENPGGIQITNLSENHKVTNPNKYIPEDVKAAHQQKAVKIEGFVQEIPVEVPISIELFGNTVNTTVKTVVKVKIG